MEDGGSLSLEEVGDEWQDVDDLCRRLMYHPRIVDLKRVWQERLAELERGHFFVVSAWSLELCVDTYNSLRSKARPVIVEPFADDPDEEPQLPVIEQEQPRPGLPPPNPVRVHLHAFLRWNKQKTIRSAESLAFLGSRPVKSTLAGGAGGRAAARGNVGLYYVQCPKIGRVGSGGSVLPYIHYLVNADWVTNLVQLGKMRYESARAELVKVGKNLPRNLQALDMWRQESEKTVLGKRIRAVVAELDKSRKPFRQLPEVQLWLESLTKVTMRYKFLVLEGPSQFGKTQFCRSLSPCPAAFLDIDCTGTTEPQMRDYRPSVHKFVLFDEASAELVIRQKRLFQASTSWVNMSQSTTNCHAYSVWVHGVHMIVCTNKWTSELLKLPAEDAIWLQQNSVHVLVDSPLWVQ